MKRFRLTYAKTEPLRYTSNLDMQKLLERLFRRAQLPIAYTQGFHPQARINQACPLPVGMLSRCELIDFWLTSDADASEVSNILIHAAPPGFEIQTLQEIDLSLPALQTLIAASRYFTTFLDIVSETDLKEKVDLLLDQPSIPRERRGKQYDLKPLIQELNVSMSSCLYMDILLSAKEGATGRPDEVISALGYDPFSARYERVALVFNQ